MRTRRIAGLVAGLVACAATPASAAELSVRVEGESRTLVPRTQVDTTGNAVIKDGNSDHACAGRSGAGALERATAGRWSGTWFDGLGYAVETVRGETHSFSSGGYWSVWLNYEPSQAGLCDIRPAAGDEMLLFPDCATAGCDSPEPLRVLAPERATSGRPFTVRVREYAPGASGVAARPAAGAVLRAGGRRYTAGADGTVRVTSEGKSVQMRATQAGKVRSAIESVCLSSSRSGCAVAGDETAPEARIATPRHARTYRTGPRVIRGSVERDPSGLRHVKLQISRTHDGRCYAWSSRREAFRRVACGEGWFFSIGDDRSWRYALDERLPRGRYLVRAVAVDDAGNRDRFETRRNRVVFRVS